MVEYGETELRDDGVDGRTGELAVPLLDVIKQTRLERLVGLQGRELAIKRQEGGAVNVAADLWEQRLEIVPRDFTHSAELQSELCSARYSICHYHYKLYLLLCTLKTL